jgi:hypothetical protein
MSTDLKGPWQHHHHQVVDQNDVEVAKQPHLMGDEEWAPYARLIALVPRMAALLRTLAEYEYRWTCSDDWCKALVPELLEVVNEIDKEAPDAPG